MKKLISVIIPVWNAERYIGGCLKSVCAQTYRALEIIAIDDGSTDESGNILDQFAAQVSQVKVFHQENLGVAAARNFGINQAEGDYIFFLDADDYMHPQALEIMEQILSDSGADVAECAFEKTLLTYPHFRPATLPIPASYKAINNPLKHLIERTHEFTPTIWNKLYRRIVIGELRFPQANIFEDTAFSICLAGKTTSAVKTDLKLVHYFCGDISLSRSQFTCVKLASYENGLRYVWQFYQKNFPSQIISVQQSFISWHVRVMINAVCKCRGKQADFSLLYKDLAQRLYRLKKDGIISFKGLSLGKKIHLLTLLCKGKTNDRNLTCIQ